MLGGLAPTHALRRHGYSARRLAAAVHQGEIVRVRRGWYAEPHEAPERLRAVRVGGRLGCASGAAEHGMWVRPAARTHVSVRATASRLRTAHDATTRLAAVGDDSVVVHWDETRAGSRFLAHPLDCLLQMIRCEPVEYVVAAADSAIRSGLISRAAWRRAIARVPARRRRVLEAVDPRSESITESLTRVRLVLLGVSLRTQVRVLPGVRVDLLLGERLVVELEGFAFHGGRDQFESDRQRFAALSSAGYRVLWFSYRQVTESWPTVWAAIRAALRRGDHR